MRRESLVDRMGIKNKEVRVVRNGGIKGGLWSERLRESGR